MAPALRYTLLRFALFIGCCGLFWLLGLRGLALIVAGGVASMGLSLWLLQRPRDELSARIDERVQHRTAVKRSRWAAQIDADADAEDAEVGRDDRGPRESRS